jgi:hypothetical protein
VERGLGSRAQAAVIGLPIRPDIRQQAGQGEGELVPLLAEFFE